MHIIVLLNGFLLIFWWISINLMIFSSFWMKWWRSNSSSEKPIPKPYQQLKKAKPWTLANDANEQKSSEKHKIFMKKFGKSIGNTKFNPGFWSPEKIVSKKLNPTIICPILLNFDEMKWDQNFPFLGNPLTKNDYMQ